MKVDFDWSLLFELLFDVHIKKQNKPNQKCCKKRKFDDFFSKVKNGTKKGLNTRSIAKTGSVVCKLQKFDCSFSGKVLSGNKKVSEDKKPMISNNVKMYTIW